MTAQEAMHALGGGGLIGLGAGLLLLSIGQGAGVSGILDGALRRGTATWRWTFLGGLALGGLLLRVWSPGAVAASSAPPATLAFAGLLVGFGARLGGGGCTSGHGIVGNSRLSVRSLVATALFMAVGFMTVALARGLHV